jgi:hypothetical protein
LLEHCRNRYCKVDIYISLGFLWGFCSVSCRVWFRDSLGFDLYRVLCRVSDQEFLSGCSNVHVGFIRASLRFHLGCHSGFFRVSFRVSSRGSLRGSVGFDFGFL